ncbi:hypothetical protein ACFFJ4_00725 [Xanthomonas dyei]|uniref:Uncharacterized protein n=1 Tax=Xanthomonas dyei TaxID=743699 RepID=A0A2S7CBP3_9XANT|nr:hypothetical protein [Xanthomonas dyei]MCC4632954.1 hypothetical protein [Xanthomonas dyei pv. eucalypti]PPU58999.1 hypothetical protein XdyCFBP7245_00710 [Xanthomonas dyei]WOB28030.1 hypothetical protein NYR99_08990 [Xanthomonas dyei]WOB55651.1 hypothetical protein NYR95_08995 [Xanthomonas dyei]
MPRCEELATRLDALQNALPQLPADEDTDVESLDFQARAEAVLRGAKPEEAAHVCTRVDGMLVGGDLIRADGEGRACR